MFHNIQLKISVPSAPTVLPPEAPPLEKSKSIKVVSKKEEQKPIRANREGNSILYNFYFCCI